MRLWLFGRLPFYGLMTLNWIKAARVNVSSSVWGNIAKTLVRYPSSSRTVPRSSLTCGFQIFFIGLSLLSDDTAALLWLPRLSVCLSDSCLLFNIISEVYFQCLLFLFLKVEWFEKYLRLKFIAAICGEHNKHTLSERYEWIKLWGLC